MKINLKLLSHIKKRDIVELIVILAIVMFINTFIFSFATVSGESMNPTLENKDRLILKKYGAVLKIGDYNYGDIVVFKSPLENDDRYFIKRIIARPGDKIEIRAGKLYINNKYIEESYIDDNSYTEALIYGKDYIVPEKEYFVIGDNRFSGKSNDSRAFGSISINIIKGKAIYRVYPFNKMDKL